MMACEDKVASLVDAAAGELPGAARLELETHLASCPGCVAELRALRETELLLRSTSQVPDELQLSGFAYRVADRAEAFRDRSPRGVWWSITRGARLAMTFSATALVAALALFLGARSPHPVVSRTMPHAAPVVATVVAPSDAADAWEEYIPEAVDAVHDQGLALGDDGDHPVSLDYGLEALSPAEMDALSEELDQSAG